MAAADRVEGTLFGNGERTGNVDLVTLALNMYSQGVHPGLDFSRINEAIECAEFCNQFSCIRGIPTRATWSSRHFPARTRTPSKALRPGRQRSLVGPYLPIDPKDIGRSYDRSFA